MITLARLSLDERAAFLDHLNYCAEQMAGVMSLERTLQFAIAGHFGRRVSTGVERWAWHCLTQRSVQS